MVEVVEGDLKNLIGRVVSMEGENVTLKPHHKDLKVNEIELTYVYSIIGAESYNYSYFCFSKKYCYYTYVNVPEKRALMLAY